MYKCSGQEDCAMSRLQRNRCQYCRFKKCLKVGMVLSAVREDRMPGGRNSGAVYNLYKVKYKKYKKKNDTKTQDEPLQNNLKTNDNPGYLYKEKVGKVELDDCSIGSLSSMIHPQKLTNTYSGSFDTSSSYCSSLASRNQFLCKILNSQSEKFRSTEIPQHSGRLENVAHLLKNYTSNTQHVQPKYNEQTNSATLTSNFGSYKPTTHTMSNTKTSDSSYSEGWTTPHGECMDLSKIPGNHDITFDPTQLWVNTNKISLSSECSTGNQKKVSEMGNSDDSKMKKSHSSVTLGKRPRAEQFHAHKLTSASLPASLKDFTEGDGILKNSSDSLDVTVNSSVDSNDRRLSDDENQGPSTMVLGFIDNPHLTNETQTRRISPWCQSSCHDSPLDCRKSLSDILDCLKYLHTEFNLNIINDNSQTVTQNMCNLGDKFVTSLVSWTRHLPFYSDIPIQLHSKLLTAKWHKLLLLSVSAQQVQHSKQCCATFDEFYQHKLANVKNCLLKLFSDNLNAEDMSVQMNRFIKHICGCMYTFNNMSLTKEEYACLQIILLLDQGGENRNETVAVIHDRYVKTLQWYIEDRYGRNTQRLENLLSQIPEIQNASDILLQTNMIYIPFFLNL